jgi:hypothetical protein
MSVARAEILVCDKCGRRDGDAGGAVRSWSTSVTDANGRVLRESHGELCEPCLAELAEVLPTTPGRRRRRRNTITVTDPETGEPV